MTAVTDRPLRADAARNAQRILRAALDQCIAEDLTPTIEAVRGADDPLHGLAQLIDAAISLGAREHNLLTAARRAGSLTPDISTSLYEALDALAHRGQQAGVVRADLVADDLPRLIAMLHSVLWTMDSNGDGWRRYVALILDAISVDDRRPLPPAAAFRFAPESSSWP